MLGNSPLFAQQSDTLTGVQVLSVRPGQKTNSTTIALTLGKGIITALNSGSIAEAARFLPGIQVKDYGGIGGLKTVSLRSLGANYTTVLYNGMILSDAQGGQTDLGRFSLYNTNAIEYTLNNPSSGLSPARAYANAALINIVPQFEIPNGETRVTSGIRTGSFGLINPFASIGVGISGKTSLHISGDWENANGKYKYDDYENGGNRKERLNANISLYRMEASLYHKFSEGSYLMWQNYGYHSGRGLPGAVILYTSPAGDKLVNTSLFSQLQWKARVSKSISALLSAKYSIDNKDYTNPNYPNSAGFLQNFFRQQSAYGSAAMEWLTSKFISFHYAADFVWDKLERTDDFAVNYANPKRYSLIQNAGVSFRKGGMGIQSNILHSLIWEQAGSGSGAGNISQLSPSLSVNVKLGSKQVYMRSSFKYLYRYPTFDELYFTNIGNTALRPETARLFNLGFLGETSCLQSKLKASWSVDGFYQYVSNKILAIPRQNLFQWSMMNIGKAAITGLDATLSGSLLEGNMIFSAGINYSMQYASDLTNPASVAYKKQLAYSAKHSGSLRTAMEVGLFRAGYNLIFTGSRYRAGGQLHGDRMPAFTTHDVNVAYTFFFIKPLSIELRAEANNIFNRQYEIIRYYPMPGFNYRLTLTVTYKHNKKQS